MNVFGEPSTKMPTKRPPTIPDKTSSDARRPTRSVSGWGAQKPKEKANAQRHAAIGGTHIHGGAGLARRVPGDEVQKETLRNDKTGAKGHKRRGVNP